MAAYFPLSQSTQWLLSLPKSMIPQDAQCIPSVYLCCLSVYSFVFFSILNMSCTDKLLNADSFTCPVLLWSNVFGGKVCLYVVWSGLCVLCWPYNDPKKKKKLLLSNTTSYLNTCLDIWLVAEAPCCCYCSLHQTVCWHKGKGFLFVDTFTLPCDYYRAG